MVYAVISDIHGNQEALDAVLADIARRGADRKICLGDNVGYCAGPSQCIALLKDFNAVLIGNHDFAVSHREIVEKFNFHAKTAIEWTISKLTEEEKAYLASLPYVHKEKDVTFVHATPRNPENWGYVTDLEEAMTSFNYFDTPACFIGHTHYPCVVSNGSEVIKGEGIRDKKIVFKKNYRYLVNVGSVGQPRDGDVRACYVRYDSDARVLEYHRVSYDLEECQKKMRKVKLPEFLINRLAEGR